MVGRLSAGLHITTNKPIEMRRVPDQQPHRLDRSPTLIPATFSSDISSLTSGPPESSCKSTAAAKPRPVSSRAASPAAAPGRSRTARSASSIGVPPQILCAVRPTEAAVMGQEGRPTAAPPAITSPSEGGVWAAATGRQSMSTTAAMLARTPPIACEFWRWYWWYPLARPPPTRRAPARAC